jgi:hypothetical protein
MICFFLFLFIRLGAFEICRGEAVPVFYIGSSSPAGSINVEKVSGPDNR